MKYGAAHRQLVAFEVFQGDHSYIEYSWYFLDTSIKMDDRMLVDEVYGINKEIDDSHQDIKSKQWNKYWIDAERTVKVHSIRDIHPIEFGVLLDLGIVTQ